MQLIHKTHYNQKKSTKYQPEAPTVGSFPANMVASQ